MSAIAPIPINPPPGVVVTESDRVAEGRWILPYDKVRFVHGRPQKVGGNIRISSTAMSGTPRATLCWQDFLQNGYISCGTYRKLYAFDSGLNLSDITPFRATGTLGSAPFTMASGSASVEVSQSGNEVNVGDTVIFSGAATAATVSGAVSGTGGVIKLTVSSSTGMTTGDAGVVVAGVTGTTEANGTWTITVIDGTHISLNGSTFVNNYISGGTVSDPFVRGINVNGTWLCATIIDTGHYTFVANTNASSSGTGGGASVAYEYEISVGTELGAYGSGWGVGPWGLGTWGTAHGTSTIAIEPRVWSLDHFGYVLVATYNGGAIWFFDPTQSEPWGRALATYMGGSVSGAPTNFRAMFITPERFIFGLCDAMVVNVCSQGDPTTWTPATTNTAFARTLQIGSKLVGGRVLAPFLSMVWSDAAAYLFQYTGSQYLYNSSLAGLDCGLISPDAAVTVDGFAYWMGPDNFYFYNGTVAPMPNAEDIRKYVFDALPTTLAYQCAAVYVPKYHEIWFFYPTTGSTNPTNYVIFHINDQVWSVGTANFYSSVGVTAGRASGSHFTQGDTSPIMAGTDGYLYNHDPANGNYDDNGNPLTWTMTLSPYALNEGVQSLHVEGILWDFFQQSGTISATVNCYDRLTDAAPMDTQTQMVPDTLAGLTDYLVEGRYISPVLTCTELGSYMRLGKPAAFVRPTGKRR